MTTPFEQLQRISNDGGIVAGLDFLEQFARRQRDYAQLFEVLKMKVRNRMNLPLLYSAVPDDLDDSQQRELEDGLLAACREVGMLFFKNGDFQQGWTYLQPVGDKKLNQRLIQSVPVNEDNADALIDIAVGQGGAPEYGFGLLLKYSGTCNGVTTFDTQAAMFDLPTRRQMAAALLDHLYDQLLENLIVIIKESGKTLAKSICLGEVLDQHRDLVAGAYVVDATHLASVVRIARILPEEAQLKKAFDLARFGSDLPRDFQYPGDAPFEDTYADHVVFFGALLGKQVDQAIDHFETKSARLDPQQHGSVAIETLVDLLARVGRGDQAIQLMVQRLLGQYPPLGVAPFPMELARTPGQQQQLLAYYQASDDLLGFGQCLLSAGSNTSFSEKESRN